MKKPAILVLALLLAVGSFAFGRYRYTNRHSATLTNPFNAGEKAKVTDPFMNRGLFSDWVKHEVVLAVIVPVALIAGGVVLAARK